MVISNVTQEGICGITIESSTTCTANIITRQSLPYFYHVEAWLISLHADYRSRLHFSVDLATREINAIAQRTVSIGQRAPFILSLSLVASHVYVYTPLNRIWVRVKIACSKIKCSQPTQGNNSPAVLLFRYIAAARSLCYVPEKLAAESYPIHDRRHCT